MKKVGLLSDDSHSRTFKEACTFLQNHGSYDLALFFELLGNLQGHLS